MSGLKPGPISEAKTTARTIRQTLPKAQCLLVFYGGAEAPPLQSRSWAEVPECPEYDVRYRISEQGSMGAASKKQILRCTQDDNFVSGNS